MVVSQVRLLHDVSQELGSVHSHGDEYFLTLDECRLSSTPSFDIEGFPELGCFVVDHCGVIVNCRAFRSHKFRKCKVGGLHINGAAVGLVQSRPGVPL